MSTALYRLYRPQRFQDVEGQPSATGVLIKSISTGHAAHAYLFSGARGCGKTTVARIVAKSLNCTSLIDNYEPCCKCSNCTSITNGENLDVIEIDGASNNGVEEIRELKSHVSLAPFNSRFKVYIIDEVHMLSTAAFNALLKTLEEPPEYVIFILATTEPHKVPVTIRSRCQHIPFQRIRSIDILNRLEFICKEENLEYEYEALWEIARQADGALRDAISLLDQVMSFGKGRISLDDVSALVGGGSLVALQRWLSAWRKGGEESFLQLNNMFQRGASPQRTIEELFYISRNLWIAKEFGCECVKNTDISKEEYDYIVEESKIWNSKSLEHLMLFLAKLLPQVKYGMRADVIVGILMSRRPEIMGGENKTDDIHSDTKEKIKPMEDEIKQKPPLKIKPSDSSKEKIKPLEEEVSHKPPLIIKSSDLLKEGFKPLEEEISHKFLSNLKANDFALFCALFDSDFLYNSEQNKICIITKHDYLFHFLSGEKNFLAFIKTVGEEYPECELNIVCEGKSYDRETNDHIVSLMEDAGGEPVKRSLSDEPESLKEIEVRKGSVLYDVAHNVMKFMRGEIVMHRIVRDKTDEFDIS